jgi:hypothetical protein
MKGELQQLRQRINSVETEMQKMKAKNCDPNPKLPDQKPTLNQIVINYPVFMCFVGFFVGLLVSYMFFK